MIKMSVFNKTNYVLIVDTFKNVFQRRRSCVVNMQKKSFGSSKSPRTAVGLQHSRKSPAGFGTGNTANPGFWKGSVRDLGTK